MLLSDGEEFLFLVEVVDDDGEIFDLISDNDFSLLLL
jgi:hypothetical protein